MMFMNPKVIRAAEKKVGEYIEDLLEGRLADKDGTIEIDGVVRFTGVLSDFAEKVRSSADALYSVFAEGIAEETEDSKTAEFALMFAIFAALRESNDDMVYRFVEDNFKPDGVPGLQLSTYVN